MEMAGAKPAEVLDAVSLVPVLKGEPINGVECTAKASAPIIYPT